MYPIAALHAPKKRAVNKPRVIWPEVVATIAIKSPAKTKKMENIKRSHKVTLL
jgi:hypothetical protein